MLSLSLPLHPQHVLDEADGDVGEVEAVEDVVVLHDGFQVVEADEVDQLVDASQAVVADGLGVAVEQEAGVEDVAGLGAVDQGVDLERGQLLQAVGADAIDGGDVVFVDLLGLPVGDLDLEWAHDVVAVVQHLAVHGGRVLGLAQAVDGQLGGRGTGLDGLSQVDGEAWQVIGQEQGGSALEDEGITGAAGQLLGDGPHQGDVACLLWREGVALKRPWWMGLRRVLVWWYRWLITHTLPSACVPHQQSSGVARSGQLDERRPQAAWPARGAARLALWCRASQ